MNQITGTTLILRFFVTTETIDGMDGYKNYPCLNEADIIKE